MIKYHDYSEFLKTEIQKGNPEELKNKREKRILEALNWKRGSSDSPKKHIIAVLPKGLEVYFLKPGKEVLRKTPNVNDMTPCVGRGFNYSFDDIWRELSKISVYDFEIFKAVLTLVYRNAYLLDHVEVAKNRIRYNPNVQIMSCIEDMEQSLGDIMDYGLFGFLHFLDILGWNEDVKYHVENGIPTFKGKHEYKTGRLNTLLTCITIPYKTYSVVEDILKHSSSPQDINWELVYETMMALARTRGICPPKQSELLEWLSPYITNERYLPAK